MVLILRSEVCDADGRIFEQDKQMEAVGCTLVAEFLAIVHYYCSLQSGLVVFTLSC